MIEISKQSCDFSLIVRGRKLLTRVLGLFLTSLVLEPALSAQSISSYRGKTMGTYYAVKYVGVSPAPLQPEFERILKDLNRQMSTYINDSEISTFNSRALLCSLLKASDLASELRLEAPNAAHDSLM